MCTLRSFTDAEWPQIEQLRARVNELANAESLVGAAQGFVEIFSAAFASVVLARLFAVLPAGTLPPTERTFAAALAGGALTESTPVLSLLGTAGQGEGWSERTASVGHRAIPLLSSATIDEAPMIAKLLADLGADLQALDAGGMIATRQLLGGRNGTFFVPDARTAVDSRGRHVIAARDFADAFAIRTVFGMGGAYLDGTMAVAIIFCSEELDRLTVDRFPSFIASFKMATSKLQRDGRIFPA